MSAKTDAATTELARIKRIYQYGLYQVDKLLESAVAANPADLSAARAVQATYLTGITKGYVLPAFFPPYTTVEVPQLTDGPPSATLV